jgi:hypothetical protein
MFNEPYQFSMIINAAGVSENEQIWRQSSVMPFQWTSARIATATGPDMDRGDAPIHPAFHDRLWRCCPSRRYDENPSEKTALAVGGDPAGQHAGAEIDKKSWGVAERVIEREP